MLRSSFAASLLLPMLVLGRGKNDATSAESAFTTQMPANDNQSIKLHHWTVQEEGVWRLYGEIEGRFPRNSNTAAWLILWWIFQNEDAYIDKSLKDGVDFAPWIDGNQKWRNAQDINFKDIRGSNSSWPHDSNTWNKDPSINWANPTDKWIQDCTTYDLNLKADCNEVRYRFFRNFETSQENEDYQLSIDESYCSGTWKTWMRIGTQDKQSVTFYPTSACIPDDLKNPSYVEGTWSDPFDSIGLECVNERVRYPDVQGAASNGDMKSTNSRRSYNLIDDDNFKQRVSCFEDENADGEPMLHCKLQVEIKPCRYKNAFVDTGFAFGLTGDGFWDYTATNAYDLTNDGAWVTVKDGSDGDTRDSKEDPIQLEPESGWVTVNFNDQTIRDPDGSFRGYFEVDVARPFTTNEPDVDPQIEADEVNCDRGFFLGAYYVLNGNVVGLPWIQNFMPSQACIECFDSGRCTPVVEGNYNYREGGVTMAASLGMATTALALLNI